MAAPTNCDCFTLGAAATTLRADRHAQGTTAQLGHARPRRENAGESRAPSRCTESSVYPRSLGRLGVSLPRPHRFSPYLRAGKRFPQPPSNGFSFTSITRIAGGTSEASGTTLLTFDEPSREYEAVENCRKSSLLSCSLFRHNAPMNPEIDCKMPSISR